MGFWSVRSATAIALLCAAALIAGSSVAQAAGTSVPLGQIGFGSIAVDDTHSHVFVSGPTANEVLVFDFDGTLVKTIPNIYGAGAMVVRGSTLYVVERNVGAIEAIDLNSLTDSGPVGSGLTMPAGSRLRAASSGRPSTVSTDGRNSRRSLSTEPSPSFRRTTTSRISEPPRAIRTRCTSRRTGCRPARSTGWTSRAARRSSWPRTRTPTSRTSSNSPSLRTARVSSRRQGLRTSSRSSVRRRSRRTE
jgi:hypothetical protein